LDKDQALGALIFLICAIVAVAYLIALLFPGIVVAYLRSTWTTLSISSVRYWLVAIPVLVAFLAILAIGAWIGWTMATTPPPKPLEEIETQGNEKMKESGT